MTEQQYPPPPLRPQPGVRPERRPTPWAAIIGVAFLGLLATILLIVLITDGDEEPTGSPSAEPSGSASPSASVSASAVPSASASVAPASAAPSGSPTALTLDTIVQTTVDSLSVRLEPGVGAERLGSLALGSPSYLAAGPTEADGLQWYQVSGLGLPPATGCAGTVESDPFNCPYWFGWVAAASETGEPWLEPAPRDCPATPLTAEALIVGRSDIQRLACFGGEPFTFRGWWPEIPDDAGLGGACAAAEEPSGWLYCQNINYNQVTINENEEFGGVGVSISIDPASGVAMPDPGTWVELRVHLDDAAAQGCDEAAAVAGDDGRAPEQAVLDCRAELVVESATAVDGP